MKEKALDGLPVKEDGGVKVYDVSRPGGMPYWLPEQEALAELDRQRTVAESDRPAVTAGLAPAAVADDP